MSWPTKSSTAAGPAASALLIPLELSEALRGFRV